MVTATLPTPEPEALSEKDRPRTTSELAEYVARRRGKCHRNTIYEWLMEGVEVPDGRVKLEGERLGGFWYSTFRAVDKFFAELTRRSRGSPVAETPDAAAQRARKDQERARRKLGKRK